MQSSSSPSLTPSPSTLALRQPLWAHPLLGGSALATLGAGRKAFAFAREAAGQHFALPRAEAPAEAVPAIIEIEAEPLDPSMWPIGQAERAGETVTANSTALEEISCVSEAQTAEPEAEALPPLPCGAIPQAQVDRLLATLSERFALTAQRRSEPSIVPVEQPRASGYHIASRSPTALTPPPIPEDYFISLEQQAQPNPEQQTLLLPRPAPAAEDDAEAEEMLLKDYTVGFGELMQQTFASPPPQPPAPKPFSGYHLALPEEQAAAYASSMEVQATDITDLAPPPRRARPVGESLVPNPNRQRRSWKAWITSLPEEL